MKKNYTYKVYTITSATENSAEEMFETREEMEKYIGRVFRTSKVIVIFQKVGRSWKPVFRSTGEIIY